MNPTYPVPREEERKGPDAMYVGMMDDILATREILSDSQLTLLAGIRRKLRQRDTALFDIQNRLNGAQKRREPTGALIRLEIEYSVDIISRSEARKIEAIYAYACRG